MSPCTIFTNVFNSYFFYLLKTSKAQTENELNLPLDGARRIVLGGVGGAGLLVARDPHNDISLSAVGYDGGSLSIRCNVTPFIAIWCATF